MFLDFLNYNIICLGISRYVTGKITSEKDEFEEYINFLKAEDNESIDEEYMKFKLYTSD